MIRGPAGRCRIDAIEPEIAEFQRIDEHIHRANRIALVDPIIKAFRQQRRLLAIRPLNKALHHPPAIQQGNHSIVGVFTQPGPRADYTLPNITSAFCESGRLRVPLFPRTRLDSWLWPASNGGGSPIHTEGIMPTQELCSTGGG